MRFSLNLRQRTLIGTLAAVFPVSCFGGAILPPNTSDVITVLAPDGVTIVDQVGVTEGGMIFGSGAFCLEAPSFTSGCTPGAEDPNGVYAINDRFVGGPGAAIILCDSAPCNLSMPANWSDAVGSAKETPTGPDLLFFVSDFNTSLPLPSVPTTFMVETGSAIDFTSFLSASFQSAGFTASFESIENSTTTTPEPGSLELVGLTILVSGLRHLFTNRVWRP